MASQRNKRRSRKARRGKATQAASRPGSQPAVPATAAPQPRVAPQASSASKPGKRREREARERAAARSDTQASRLLGTYGERPLGIFGPVPVAEFAIVAGFVALVVGYLEHSPPALITGLIVCALGVLESSAREHFSGYRSHATLLAAFPAIAMEVCLALFVGVPTKRVLLLLPVVPVFAASFWLLQRAFGRARHARVAKSPGS